MSTRHCAGDFDVSSDKGFTMETEVMITEEEEEEEANRVSQEMLAAVTAGALAEAHNGNGHEFHAGSGDMPMIMEDVVHPARATSADASEFSYATGTSSEEVAMLEALLRHTAASEAAAAAAVAAVAETIVNATMTPAKDSATLRTGEEHAVQGGRSLHGSPQLQVADLERHCFECSGDDSLSGNKLMYCSNCHRNYHQLCHDPVVDDVWAETVTEWLCHDCIQKYGVQFTAESDEVPGTPIVPRGDDDRQSDTMDSGLAIGAEIAKTTNRRMEQAVSGIGISYAQKKNYLNTLPKSVLVDLVLACDATHPDMPLFPASLHAQALSTPGVSSEYDRMSDWAQEANGETPSRPKPPKARTPAERSLADTPRSSRETVTGLTPRRTQGRRAPRSAAGHPLPSYEDLCVEAVLDMNKPGGSLPKRIFEWIATNYPVAPNFRPSCSQALQRAYRKGKLEKHGRAYKVSASELEHIREYQEQQRQVREASGESGKPMDSRTAASTAAVTAVTTAAVAKLSAGAGALGETVTELQAGDGTCEGAGDDEHEERPIAVDDGIPANVMSSTTDMAVFDRAVALDLGGAAITEAAAAALAAVEQHVDVLSMHADAPLPGEATEEDTAAIVAAVTAGNEVMLADELDVDGTHVELDGRHRGTGRDDDEDAIINAVDDGDVDLVVRAVQQVLSASRDAVAGEPELDVELDMSVHTDVDADAETDGAAAARTAPTRHRQHRHQRRGKRSRQELAAEAALLGDSDLAAVERAEAAEGQPRQQRQRSLSTVAMGDHVAV
ncbi:hypothetical protein THASP1DRAFT_31649 [Thamnocephalis sphaerospora]|uniref:Histone H1 n=1 Tax=Thamnocephalis sphaerospora TaxID=78915 RepID=A0A4P9XL26_9FUNG|nr:hypothetical protein THASP1DRAFT_31649 [Thamnocephalis sphaerospora]|eukprot:RKP06537.1 hypothetical protein THASP1DRAFT_31649 [Thamnocephalis sphaerospora]